MMHHASYEACRNTDAGCHSGTWICTQSSAWGYQVEVQVQHLQFAQLYAARCSSDIDQALSPLYTVVICGLFVNFFELYCTGSSNGPVCYY
jgi:hypothetical protein